MTLEALNALDKNALEEALFKCCGSSSWVKKMAELAPFQSIPLLLDASAQAWQACKTEDGLEAFRHHPRIGDMQSLREKFNSTKTWAEGEQSGVQVASEEVLQQLSLGNKQYEEKFGFIFIVCATGKSAGEMLHLLQERLQHNRAQEILQAMQEQGKITKLRLQKLLTV